MNKWHKFVVTKPIENTNLQEITDWLTVNTKDRWKVRYRMKGRSVQRDFFMNGYYQGQAIFKIKSDRDAILFKLFWEKKLTSE